MKTSNTHIKTEGFRPVYIAALIIDVITLVAVENDCGKTSISKLHFFE